MFQLFLFISVKGGLTCFTTDAEYDNICKRSKNLGKQFYDRSARSIMVIRFDLLSLYMFIYCKPDTIYHSK